MSLYRHEFAHQIDARFSTAMDARQKALFYSIISRCTKDADWLRGHGERFKDIQGEIVAGQVGNQYLYSTSTQFDVARTSWAGPNQRVSTSWSGGAVASTPRGGSP